MKSQKLLESFTVYCVEHPELRFWQALRAWSGVFGQVPWVIPSCAHEWKEPLDSQFDNEVFCTKCKVVGDRDPATGEVYYPAT